MLSKELLKQIKHIELKAGFLASSALSGEYASVFKGSGIEFEKVREYLPGDDVRSIDWNVTARMNAPFVKTYKEERELTLMIGVDVSRSQYFGGAGRFKHEAAVELAAALAFLATKNNDKVGLVLFSDKIEAFIPPKKGRSHVLHIIQTVLAPAATSHGTSLEEASRFLLRILKRRSMCFMISDFEGTPLTQSFRMLAKKHDVNCVKIYDPKEKEASSCGFMSVMDAETSQVHEIDTSDPAFQKAFKQMNVQKEKELTKEFNRIGISHFYLSTGSSIAASLLSYLRKRERRLR